MVATMGFTGSTQWMTVKLTMAANSDFAGRQERDVVSIHMLEIFRFPHIQVRDDGSYTTITLWTKFGFILVPVFIGFQVRTLLRHK